MSSQSSTSRGSARRIAATLGASAALSLTLVGPAFSGEPRDPAPSPVSAQCTHYVGGGTVVSCTNQSSVGTGSGSASSAERGIPAPAPVQAPKLVLPSSEPSNLPTIGIGVVAAVLVAGGLMIASTNRRRPA